MIKNINKNLILFPAFIIIFSILLTIPLFGVKAYRVPGSYKVCTGCYVNTNTANYNYSQNTNTNKNPVLYSTNPTKIGSNAGLKSVTIIGTGFRPDSIARWNYIDKPTSYINSEKLIMELNKEDTFYEGNYIITVVNPSPEGGKFSNPKTIIVSNYIGEEIKAIPVQNVKATPVNTGSYAIKGASTSTTNTTSNTKKTNTIVEKKVEKKEEVKEIKEEKENVACITNNTDNEDNNPLIATSIKGKNNFLPDSILEWLVLVVLIVLAIILWRRIWVTRAERNKALKHA